MLKMPHKPVAALVQTIPPADSLKDLHRSTHVAFCRFEAYQRVVSSTINPKPELLEKLNNARRDYINALSTELANAKENAQ